MITTSHPQYKALTAPQRAKVRKAIAEYEAERHPIMCATHQLEESLRRKAYLDLECEARIEKLEAQHAPRLEILKQAMEKLSAEIEEIQKTVRDERSEIRTEPYRVADADPKVRAFHEIWQTVNETHEAKMTALLESFKESEVA